MKVYGSQASPFVQRVLMAARLKGHELPVEFPAGGDLKSPDFLAISPLGRIPVLDDDGWTLPESGAIVSYLDDVLTGPKLYPADPRTKARVCLIESLVQCELTGFRPIMAGSVFGVPIAAEVLAASREQIKCALGALEKTREAGDGFAVGNNATAADCALFPMLILFEIAEPFAQTLELLESHEELVRYRQRMEDDPAVGGSAREMREHFGAIIARRRGDAP